MKIRLALLTLIITLSYECFANSPAFIAAQASANAYVVANGLHYNKRLNVFTGRNDNTIHIFLFEDGNLLLAGYPTVATEMSLFQVHLFIEDTNPSRFLLEYTGSYSPTLNIENGNSAVAPPRGPGPGGALPTPVINQLDFAVLGPFTSTLILTFKSNTGPGTTFNTLTSATIQISKTIHASIGSGIVFTSLKDPSNIKKVPIPGGGGDSTIIADNVSGRSLLTVMATFYPWGRNNLMMPEWNFKDRFGIVVGTTIGSGTATFKNLLFGVQYDFSIGGSIVGGIHYGQRQRIAGLNYKDFMFGQTKFSGDLESKKYQDGNVGFFFGVAIDNRIFSQIFK